MNKQNRKAYRKISIPFVLLCYNLLRKIKPCLLIAASLTIITMFATNGNGESLEYLKKKAQAGNAKAQFHLGWIYITGQGMPKDDFKEVKWFQKAAEQGLTDAQCQLGMMYHEGLGGAEG